MDPGTIKARPRNTNAYGTNTDAPRMRNTAVAAITTKIPRKVHTTPNNTLLPVKAESSTGIKPAAISSGLMTGIEKPVARSSTPVIISIVPMFKISFLIDNFLHLLSLVPYACTQNSVTSVSTI